MSEEWRTVTGFEDYEVSDLGRIRVKETQKILKQSMNGDPYYQVTLKNKTTGKKYQSVTHRLIAREFCPNDDPEHKKIVDHKNNNSLDNKASNLEWVTQKENLRRSRERDGHKPRKKTPCMCVETGKRYESIAEASRDTGIRYYSIWSSMMKDRHMHGLHFVDLSKGKNRYTY